MSEVVVFIGGELIVLGNERVVRVSRDAVGGLLVEASQVPPRGGLYQRILAVDARRVLVSRHGWLGLGGDQPRHTWTVDALGIRDLAPLAGYDVPDDVQSVLTAGTSLYFGMNAGMVVATPLCPGP